jgi:hypothetical protein
LVEQRTFNPLATGSIPVRPTKTDHQEGRFGANAPAVAMNTQFSLFLDCVPIV